MAKDEIREAREELEKDKVSFSHFSLMLPSCQMDAVLTRVLK